MEQKCRFDSDGHCWFNGKPCIPSQCEFYEPLKTNVKKDFKCVCGSTKHFAKEKCTKCYYRNWERFRQTDPKTIRRRERRLIKKAELYLPPKTARAFILDGMLLDKREAELKSEVVKA